MRDFDDLVRSARSVRRFDETDPIPEAVLTELVDVARLVPSGANKQPLRYRLVHAEAERDAVFPLTAWAGALEDWPGPAEGERPTGYIAILAARDSTAPVIETDLGIAAQTIQLAAAARGWGACQIGSLRRDAILQALGIDDAYRLLLLVALGRAAETVVIEPLPDDGNTDYWRTPDGVHHVPKRSLDAILL